MATSPPPPPDAPQTSADLTTYHGHCHCGAFRYALRIPELKEIQLCDCSYCTKNGILGYLWIPEDGPLGEFSVEAGDEADLVGYEFAARETVHKFCPVCGTNVMARTKGWLGVNARTLADIDYASLPRRRVSRRAVGGAYAPAYGERVEWQESESESDAAAGAGESPKTTYYGNCHCGKIRYAVRWTALAELEVMSCNCSLCAVNSDLHIYPPRAAVQLRDPQASATGYAFLSPESWHCFCGMCGSFVFIDIKDRGVDIQPLNVRAVEGVQLEGLRYRTFDGRAKLPLYTGRRHGREAS